MDLRAFLLQTVVRLTAAQGAKRQRSIMKPSLHKITDFLVALAPVFVRIFLSHTFERSSGRRGKPALRSLSSKRSKFQW